MGLEPTTLYNMYSRVGMQERTYLAFEVDPAALLPHISLNGHSGKNWFG